MSTRNRRLLLGGGGAGLLSSYDFVNVWGGSREEANDKVLAFFQSSHFKVRFAASLS